jgi:glucosamine--fructose-6-phosphate aminotransferase (isomerizing)
MESHVQLDLAQQPRALRELAAFYSHGDGLARLESARGLPAPLLAGMGASLHAAQAIVPYFHSLGIPAASVESADLVFYSGMLLRGGAPLVFISQSGASAEVTALLGEPMEVTMLVAVTNDEQSLLARRAHTILPILAGAESGLATKTYVNTLALLWMLARHWAGQASGGEKMELEHAAAACEQLLADADAVAAHWTDELGPAGTLVFLGHGPHAATARQAAMMLAERARAAAIGASVAAFRHGPIEIAQPGVGVVLFGAGGRAAESKQSLAEELHGYGARVLLVEHGHTRGPGEQPAEAIAPDEFLASILNIVPAQIFADALARRRGVEPAFRYIGKVVSRL